MSLPGRLASGPKEETSSSGGGLGLSSGSGGHGGHGGPGGNKEGEPPDPNSNLMQRIVIIQRDEKGYGFTVSGDNPVFVASVKPDGAASRAGVQQGDRILKVNGTLVTNRNHLDVVKLIKSGSYVALALLGKRTPQVGGSPSPGVVGSGGGPAASTTPNIASNRDSVGGRVTAPQPVDPDKDRELQQQKINMTRSMYETAKEDFEKLQRQYVAKPSDKLHTQLLEKERTVKTLENQFKQLTGAGDEMSSMGSSSRPGSNRFSDSEHGGLDSPMQSWASSLPTTTSDLGSMSDSPQTSPSVSPTPNDPQHPRHNGQEMEDSMIGSSTHDIITIDDEDIHSEDDQHLGVVDPWTRGRSASPCIATVMITEPEANDPGPFADIRMLESRPAHMAIVLNYLISNSEPAPVLFHIISDSYFRISASTKELRKWAYEIYSTFIAQMAPLCVGVDDSIINQIDNILTTSANKTDNESTLRNMFLSARQSVQQEIAELLADFRNKRDLGMANFYGLQKLQDNMDRSTEIKVTEELLIPILEAVSSEDNNRNLRDRDQAIGWALATFLRQVAGSKSAHSGTLDRVQTFMMKDKRSIKFPGYKSNRAKNIKGHQFIMMHCYVTTFCMHCNRLIWGVGTQGYQCQTCEMTFHKQCVEEITEPCAGKRGKRGSKLIPVMIPNRRVSSNTGPNQSALSQLYQQQMGGGKVSGDATDNVGMATQPYPRDDESDLAGLPSGHSVKSIVTRYQELSSPTGPGPGLEVPGTQGKELGGVPSGQASVSQDRKGADLNRSGSLNNKGEKSDRPARRAKSDVDVDSDMFKAINQSGSSSASSLSNRSVESPSQSVEGVNSNPDAMRVLHEADSDLEVEPELPILQSVLGDDVLRKLKPKEKKRQEVINELLYTERNHLRNLKVLDLLFYRPMQQERGVKVMFELALALFPNMEEMISLHETLVKDIKVRSKTTPVKEVGDLLLKRFDGEAGEKFRKGCAEYCRNQAFALEALKKHTRKEPKLAQFLTDAESNPMCRRLQLKDLVPSQMQRLTKYPLLIDSLMKHTQSHSDEYKHLEQAHEKCKHILAYVNQAVKECENYHKIRDIQRKLDTKSIEATTEDMLEIKNMDLSQHKLIFDGPLTWKLRGHRTVDLHLLLFDDMLVLLQKQDDRYVLKFQSTNAQVTRDEPKYSHGPVLRLKNVLARNLATDKKSFFVVNMTDVGAQMYEFTASTSELRIKWCKLINDKVDEVKRQGGSGGSGVGGVSVGPGGPAVRSQSLNQSPKPEQIELQRSKTTRISRKNRSVRNPNAGSPSDSPPLSPPPKVAATEDQDQDQIDGFRSTIGSVGDADDGSTVSELIQPEEVRVDSAVVMEAQAVRSPMELLRENTELIMSALHDQDRLVMEVLRVSGGQTLIRPQELETNGEAREKKIRTRERGERKRARRKSSIAEGEVLPLAETEMERKDSIDEKMEETQVDDEEDEDEEDDEGEKDEEEELQEVLVAKALRLNARCLQIITSESLTLAQQPPPPTSSPLLQQQQQQLAASEEILSPTSSARRMSNLSQGSPSDAESRSSNSMASLTAATATSTASQPAQQPVSPTGRGAPLPREQLKNMAAEMNTILTKLMGAMNVGAEERHRLRQELAEAQERLSALKELQRQMTEAGVVPPDRIPLETTSMEDDYVDIPRATMASSSSAARAGNTSGLPQQASTGSASESRGQEEQLTPDSPAADAKQVPAETFSTPLSSPGPLLEASIAPLAAAAAAAAATSSSVPEPQQQEQQQQQQQRQDAEFVGGGLMVHHSVQETTELEESVEALALTSAPANVVGSVQVSVKDGRGDNEEDEDDDDNNEVSVKDLPLPDVNLDLPVRVVEEEEEDQEVRSSQAPSSLLDAVDLDDSDSDTEEGPSRLGGGGGGHLATTLEEEEEEENRGLDGEDEEALLRKITDSSLLSSSLLSSALASPSAVDTEIIAVPGEEGNNNKEDSSSSNVDGPSSGRPPSSSVDAADTTPPIEI